MVANYIRKAAEWPSSNEVCKNSYPYFLHLSQLSRQVASDMPYENHTFYLNPPLNVHGPDSAPASTSAFALDNATRQPRRRAESMPWSNQTSILGSRRNSLQLKKTPQSLPIPHFVEPEHERDVEMVWQDGLGDSMG
jgi:hypothetical protein